MREGNVFSRVCLSMSGGSPCRTTTTNLFKLVYLVTPSSEPYLSISQLAADLRLKGLLVGPAARVDQVLLRDLGFR